MASDRRFLNTLLIRLPFPLNVILRVVCTFRQFFNRWVGISHSEQFALHLAILWWYLHYRAIKEGVCVSTTGPSRKACVFLMWFLDFLSYSNFAIVVCGYLSGSVVSSAGQTSSHLPVTAFLTPRFITYSLAVLFHSLSSKVSLVLPSCYPIAASVYLVIFVLPVTSSIKVGPLRSLILRKRKRSCQRWPFLPRPLWHCSHKQLPGSHTISELRKLTFLMHNNISLLTPSLFLSPPLIDWCLSDVYIIVLRFCFSKALPLKEWKKTHTHTQNSSWSFGPGWPFSGKPVTFLWIVRAMGPQYVSL